MLTDALRTEEARGGLRAPHGGCCAWGGSALPKSLPAPPDPPMQVFIAIIILYFCFLTYFAFFLAQIVLAEDFPLAPAGLHEASAGGKWVFGGVCGAGAGGGHSWGVHGAGAAGAGHLALGFGVLHLHLQLPPHLHHHLCRISGGFGTEAEGPPPPPRHLAAHILGAPMPGGFYLPGADFSK